MTVAQSRVLRVAAWVAAVLLVLTFVMRGYNGFHPDMFPGANVPCACGRGGGALLAGALVAGGLVYACVEAKDRSCRIVAGFTSDWNGG